MAEIVGSAVAQEFVSGAFSFMRSNHDKMASQSHLMERLKMAHLELKFALERSRRMPITDVSLLQKRMTLKHAFEECRDVLYQNEDAEQLVPPLSPSMSKRIMHAVKPFFKTRKCSMSGSCIRRFEWFAEKANKFVRDLESGCSLANYRFSSPLISRLLESKHLYYEMICGSQTRKLQIIPSFLEDYGAMAYLMFQFKDIERPMKCFFLCLLLRLSESTDIVGVSTKCLESLEPKFKPFADVASEELALISTQAGFSRPEPACQEFWFNTMTVAIRTFRKEPLCCIGDGFQISAKNTLFSVKTERFSEQVSYVGFQCFIAAHAYNLQSPTNEMRKNTVKAWPILQMSVDLLPHFSIRCSTYGVDLSKMAELVPMQAVDCFKIDPRRTEFRVLSVSTQGFATFTVNKPTSEEMGCAPKVDDGSKTRRVSKRKR